MREPTQLEKQQYQRLIELSDMARQRYLNAGGDPRRSAGSLHGNDYLTDEERKEFLQLGRQVFGVQIKDGYVHCQGRSWKLPDNSPLSQDEANSVA